MFCEEKSTLKEKIQGTILFIIVLAALFYMMSTVTIASTKHELKSSWEQKNFSTEKVRSMYDTNTDESEFMELDAKLSFELVNYLEYETGSKISEISDYNKIVLTVIWISEYMEYDYKNDNKYTYDVLKYKIGDCVGYADLFYTCMQKLEISCEIVTMNANIESKDFKKLNLKQASKTLGLGHAINLVNIEGSNYLVDCCWYDASGNADYILFGQTILAKKYMDTNMGEMGYVRGYKLSEDVFSSIEVNTYTN